MFRRLMPAVCATCKESVPRAAAGRCPSCRTDFSSAAPITRTYRRRQVPVREQERIAAPRDPRRLP